MRLHEHEAASLFRQAGVPVAPFAVARTADEAVMALTKVELPVVIKAQVLVGSRGKHGGILLANTEARNDRMSRLNFGSIRMVCSLAKSQR